MGKTIVAMFYHIMGYLKLNGRLIPIVTLLIIGCSTIKNDFKRVLEVPNRFNGKEIEVSGIAYEQQGGLAIYLTDDGEKAKALWVRYGIFGLLNTFEGGVNGKKVRVKGKFDKNDKGYLGQYFGTLTNAGIVAVEATDTQY